MRCLWCCVCFALLLIGSSCARLDFENVNTAGTPLQLVNEAGEPVKGVHGAEFYAEADYPDSLTRRAWLRSDKYGVVYLKIPEYASKCELYFGGEGHGGQFSYDSFDAIPSQLTLKTLVYMTLEVEGKTLDGFGPMLAPYSHGFEALYDKPDYFVSMSRKSDSKWNVGVVPGAQYVVGWVDKKMRRESRMYGFVSEPFTAMPDGKLTIEPGLPISLGVDLTDPPPYVADAFPINVYLYKVYRSGEKDTHLSWRAPITLTSPGVARFENIAPGRWKIDFATSNRAAPPGTMGFFQQTRDVALSPNQDITLKKIWPEYDVKVDKGDVEIRGLVLDRLGNPIGGGTVSITAFEPGGPARGDVMYPSAKVADDGMFMFRGLAPGNTYHLSLITADNQHLSAAAAPSDFVGGIHPAARVVMRRVGDPAMLKDAEPAPNLTLDWMDDNSSTPLSSLQGSTVVMDVWATWCGPCRAAMPDMNDLAAKYASRPGIKFIAVSIDTDRAPVEKYLAKHDYPNLRFAWIDPAKNPETISRPIPFTLIINPDGTIRTMGNGVDIEAALGEP